MSSGMRLSVVVSAYNETESLRETLRRLRAADKGYIHEIILAASPKGSPQCLAVCQELVAADPQVKLHIQTRVPGAGWAFRESVALATGTHVAMLSADLETEPEAVQRMVDKVLETGCDGVIANRWLKGGGFVNYDRLKYVLNWIFQKTFSILYWTRLGDLTYGYKLLSKEVCDSIEWEGVLHEYFIETTVKPIKAGFRLEQIPTIWIGRKEGVSANTFWRNFRYVKMALSVWWKGVRRIAPKAQQTA